MLLYLIIFKSRYIFLEVGSGTYAFQTAKIMIRSEEVLLREKPALIIILGNVNSTLACALVVKKIFIDIAHIKAGLRGFSIRMPEEINEFLQINWQLFYLQLKRAQFRI